MAVSSGDSGGSHRLATTRGVGGTSICPLFIPIRKVRSLPFTQFARVKTCVIICRTACLALVAGVSRRFASFSSFVCCPLGLKIAPLLFRLNSRIYLPPPTATRELFAPSSWFHIAPLHVLIPPRSSLPLLCCSRVTYFPSSLTAPVPRIFDRFSRVSFNIGLCVQTIPFLPLHFFSLVVNCAFFGSPLSSRSLVSPFFVYFLPSLSVSPAVHRPYPTFSFHSYSAPVIFSNPSPFGFSCRSYILPPHINDRSERSYSGF